MGKDIWVVAEFHCPDPSAVREKMMGAYYPHLFYPDGSFLFEGDYPLVQKTREGDLVYGPYSRYWHFIASTDGGLIYGGPRGFFREGDRFFRPRPGGLWLRREWFPGEWELLTPVDARVRLWTK